MIRKLVSSLLCAFALLLLMGAGVASEQTTPILAEEESAAETEVALETENQRQGGTRRGQREPH